MSVAARAGSVFSGMALVVACCFSSGALAADEAPDASEARQLQAQVIRCFNPPDGATGPATVTFTLDAEGGFAVAPVVAEKAAGKANAVFAAAALRAVVRCSPFKGVRAQSVRMTFRPGVL